MNADNGEREINNTMREKKLVGWDSACLQHRYCLYSITKQPNKLYLYLVLFPSIQTTSRYVKINRNISAHTVYSHRKASVCTKMHVIYSILALKHAHTQSTHLWSNTKVWQRLKPS